MNEGARASDRWTGLMDVALMAVVLGILGLFVYTVRDVIGPPVAFLLLLLVLTPLWGRPIYRTVSVAATLLFLLWFLRETGSLLAPFVLAVILTYILDPLVDRIERLKLPRSLAIAVLVLPVLGLGVLAVVFGAPALGREVSNLIDELPGAWDAIAGWLDGARGWIVSLGIPGLGEESLPRVREVDAQAISAYVQSSWRDLAERLWSGALGLGRGLATAITVFGYVVLTPVVTFYVLRDYDRMLAGVRDLLPESRREGWSAFAAEFHELLSRYLRGQVTVAALVGLITFLGFWILDFPFALLLGATAGLFNLVPYLGLYVSLVPALAIALLSGSIVVSLLKVAVVFGVAQLLEGSVLSPLIVGQSVELNPVWIMVALAVFGYFFGLTGLLLAVPLAILVKLAVGRAIATYRSSEFYGGVPAEGGR